MHTKGDGGDVLGTALHQPQAWIPAADVHRVMAHDYHAPLGPGTFPPPSTECQFTGMREPSSSPSTTILNFMATGSPLSYSTMTAVAPWPDNSFWISATVFLATIVVELNCCVCASP